MKQAENKRRIVTIQQAYAFTADAVKKCRFNRNKSITEGDFAWICSRNCEDTEQLRRIIIRKLYITAMELLFPPRCVLCDELLSGKESGCCRKCSGKLPRIRGPVCMKCGKPLKQKEQEFCLDCQRVTHGFDRGVAAFTYSGRMRESVFRMKFQNRRDYTSFYGEAMAEAVSKHLPRWNPQIIIPVPMHPSKRKSRGYNQAELLALAVSSKIQIPAATDLLRCIRRTEDQKILNRKERSRNLRGCFQVRRELKGIQSVLLVDDVYTTGSTMDEISRVLKEAGVRQVYFVVLCTGRPASPM